MSNKSKKRIVVVGGSAAGPKAAARARRLDQEAEITIVQKDPDLSMASCGYPYYVGGFFNDRKQLICTPTGVIRDPAYFIKAKGIRALTGTVAEAVDRKSHTVRCRSRNGGGVESLAYDKLILATGATPKMPPVPAIDLQGVTTLHSLRDFHASGVRIVSDIGGCRADIGKRRTLEATQ